MAAHKDGSVIVYNKEREDGIVDIADEIGEGNNNHGDGTYDCNVRMYIKKSTESRNQKTNPVAVWQVSTRAINAIAFAPDNRHVAFACFNNSWRMVDYVKEE
jgi:hypothetical protein